MFIHSQIQAALLFLQEKIMHSSMMSTAHFNDDFGERAVCPEGVSVQWVSTQTPHDPEADTTWTHRQWDS